MTERYEVARITMIKYIEDDDVRIRTECGDDLRPDRCTRHAAPE